MILRVRTKAVASVAREASTVAPLRLTVPSRKMRVLDFDCEARPLHWISGDYVSKEITAIAWKWINEPSEPECYVLGECDPRDMLGRFQQVYDRADMVTGHFILGYDLPMIQGAITEYELPPLGNKLAQDTKVHLLRRQGLSSSQENLGAMLGLEHPKVHMDQKSWRDANRLTAEGLQRVKARVIGDVRQHIELRQRLLDLGYLGPPAVWKANSDRTVPAYTP